MTQEQEVADRVARECVISLEVLGDIGHTRKAEAKLRAIVAHKLAAALLSSREEGYRQGVGARVKPLVWVERVGVTGTFDAASVFGTFIATVTDDGRGFWFISGLTTGNYVGGTVEAAKAAAQADYEQRIMSALEPGDGSRTPSPEPELTGEG